LAVGDLKLVFNFAADGYWRHDNHKFSYADLIGHATNFSEEMIPKILQTWKDRGVKSFVVGRAYLTPRLAEELNADTLVSFYNARGGLQYYLSFLKHFASAELQQLKNRCRILHNEMVNQRGNDCSLRGFMTPTGAILSIYCSDFIPTDVSIQSWIDTITEQDEVEFKDELLKLAVDLHAYWRQREAAPKTKWDKEAVLDLIVWKESVVSVEVKAPNDRLIAHQKEQLKLDADNGIKSWVIEVHDGQVDCSKADKKRQVLFGNKLPREVPTTVRRAKGKPISHPTETWQNGFKSYSKYLKSSGFSQVRQSLIFEGFKLGQWVSVQRVGYSRNKLTNEQEKALNDLGFIWNTIDYTWSLKYESYSKYIKETGDTQVPKGLIFEGFNLSKWISKQREACSNNSIKSNRKRLLDDLGFIWQPISGVHNRRSKKLNTKAMSSQKISEITMPKMPWEI
jgi:hypothetical protein